MPNWKKVVVSGSDALLNSVTASFTGSLTGALTGTASYATQALSASYALNGGVTSIVAGTNVTISPISGVGAVTINSSGGGGSAFPFVGAAKITGSLVVSGSTGGIDTINGVLSNPGSISKVDWINGLLNTTAGINTVDWENKALYDNASGVSIDWENRILSEGTSTYVAFEYSGNTYVDSQLYYRNVIPAQVQRSLADTPAYGGQVIQATVDVSAVDYYLVALDTDGVWKPTKAAVGYGAEKMLGIAVDVAGGYVLIEGDIGVSDDTSKGVSVVGADYGLPIYISTGNGELTTTIPSSIGSIVRIVGYVYHNSSTDVNWWTMKFRPSNDWYVI
jgi:hypothetical protein